MESKKIGHMQVRISRRKLVLNPTIQQVVINLPTNYQHSRLHGYGEILNEKFHFYLKYGKKENPTSTAYTPLACMVFGEILDEKFEGPDGRMNGRTDGQMLTSIPLLFQSGGITSYYIYAWPAKSGSIR